MDRIPRFWIPEINKSSLNLTINDNQVRHISRSLRLDIDDKIIVFDGISQKVLCKITNLSRNSIDLKIIENLKLNRPKKEINLYQSIPKSKKFEEILKKLTAIGINSITPIETENSQRNSRDIIKKYQRWNKIIIETCKQCERDILLRLNPPQKIDELSFDLLKNHKCIVASAKYNPKNTLSQLYQDIKSLKSPVSYFIGPEGGFTEGEVMLLKNNNIKQFSIHQNILRTETASIYLGSLLYGFSNSD